MYEQSYVALEILIYLGISVFSEVLALGLGDHLKGAWFQASYAALHLSCIALVMTLLLLLLLFLIYS